MKKVTFKTISAFLLVLFAFLYPIPHTLYPIYAQSAILSLSPSSGTFNKGCSFSLQINLDTGGAQTDGTDAIINYDQARFSATSISSGSIYPDYPGNNIDESSGKITVSGLAAVSSAFSGTGTLATVQFSVKENAQAGATQIKFDFDPNDKSKTIDSNVVERGTIADILNSVVNGNFTIGSGTCIAPSPGPARGAPGIATPTAQPKTIDEFVDQTGKGPGSPELTFTLAIVGSVLTVLGILGLALL